MRITISNFRAIASANPLTLDLSESVTFLVGRNNVGKSSLLRFFSEMKSVLALGPSASASSAHDAQLPGLFWDSLANRNGLNDPLKIRVEDDGEAWEYIVRPAGGVHTQSVRVHISPILVRNHDSIANRALVFNRVVYFGPVRSTHYNQTTGLHTAVSGSNLISTWADWSTGDNTEHQKATEQLEEEIRQIFGFRKFSMRVHKDRQALMVSFDGGTFRLSELGDGLSHFITVLASALVFQPSYLLIDEPENGLHPKMQALFVQTMAAKCSRGLVATSHSLGLARSVADRVFYCTNSVGLGLSVTDHHGFEPNKVTAELREMSYTQMIEAGEQNVLLVEGRTDVKAAREVLRLYGIEDRFIIVSLGGGDMLSGDVTRYRDELKYLGSFGAKSVAAIIDSEKIRAEAVVSASRLAFKALCEELGYEIHILEKRAMENYVPQVAVDAVLGPQVQALGSFESFAAGNGWKKSLTWKLLSATPRTILDQTDLGRFVLSRLCPKAGMSLEKQQPPR